MSRVKRGILRTKKRRKLLKEVKSFRGGRKKLVKLAKEAVLKKWSHQFVSRRLKKRDMRALWQIKINAGARQQGVSYSQLINKLKKANIALDRKVLSELAVKHPKVFEEVVKAAA